MVIGGAAFVVNPDKLAQTLLTLSASGIGSVIIARTYTDQTVGRIAMGIALIAGPAVALYVFAGHPWQLDMHMTFFAAMAVTALTCDWRAVLAAAVATAVHHLGFNFLLPSLVFPEETDAARVVVHALVVLLETGALIWLTSELVRSIDFAAEKVLEAEQEKARAEQLADEQFASERARSEAERRAQDERDAAAERQRVAEIEAQKRLQSQRRALI